MARQWEEVDAWVTKYAISGGIEKVSGRVDENGYLFYGTCSVCNPKDWYRTKGEAVERANMMLKRKIDSTEKALAKLKKKIFD